eukprot:m.101915 g.101915  ORF g.101915 m.101915 type:complete len:184 (-) comp51512_c0_seq5:76-627(-)
MPSLCCVFVHSQCHRLSSCCARMIYGDYDAAMFKSMICPVDFVILSDCTETQGYAESEIMSLDVPIFFVNPGPPVPTFLTVPYMCEECGDYYQPAISPSSTNSGAMDAIASDIAERLLDFWANIREGKYQPRRYVEQHLSLVPIFLNTMAGLCDMINIGTAEPVEPVRTQWKHAYFPDPYEFF